MRSTSFVLACLSCLACVGRGRRALLPTSGGRQSSQHARSLEPTQSFESGRLNNTQGTLAKLFLSIRELPAFKPSLPNRQSSWQTRRDVLSTAATAAAASSVAGVIEQPTAASPHGILAGSWLPIPPAAAAEAKKEEQPKGKKQTIQEINSRLAKIPAFAIVNNDSSPYFTSMDNRVGYFFLDPTQALLESKLLRSRYPDDVFLKAVSLPEVYFPYVRGDKEALGGDLKLRPNKDEVILANRCLQLQGQPFLDDVEGDVPLFFNENVFVIENNKTVYYPFFMAKEDLDRAYDNLPADIKTGKKNSAQPKSKGCPSGKTQVVTLNQIVDAMKGGLLEGLDTGLIVGSAEFYQNYQMLYNQGTITER